MYYSEQCIVCIGDITDAKNEDQISSVQHVMEWKMYQDVINKSSLIAQGIPWIDIRGNHGNL